MTTEQQAFIQQAANAINAQREQYGIAIASPIIAQMILESGWGKSKLATENHNYFGLTAGSNWKGKRVSRPTKEEIGASLVATTRDFRAYDSMADGIKGYFEFINTPRYANLKGVTDPERYIDNIIADGYCTASTYKAELMDVIRKYDLIQYDNTIVFSATKLVDEICRGVYGNGEERRKNLKALGLTDADIKAVQAEVTRTLTEGSESLDKTNRSEKVAQLVEDFTEKMLEIMREG